MAERSSDSQQAPSGNKGVVAESHPEETTPDPDEDDLDDLDGEGSWLLFQYCRLKV